MNMIDKRDYYRDDENFFEKIQYYSKKTSGSVVLTGASSEVLKLKDVKNVILSKAELKRVQEFLFDRSRRDFIAAHKLIRLAAACVAHYPPTEIEIFQHCSAGHHGPPSVGNIPGIFVGLSHSDGIVAAAAGCAPIGVDIEHWRDDGFDIEDATSFLTAAERKILRRIELKNKINQDSNGGVAMECYLFMIRQWVRKEALIKLGAIELETMNSLDLSDLAVDDPVESFFARRNKKYDWEIMDWLDPHLEVSGAVVSVRSCQIVTIN